MRLTFETDFLNPFDLDVSRADTLEEIKVKINSVYGFRISSQTLSFNGVIIATDADLHRLHAASLVDGSVIRLDIADDTATDQPHAHRDKRVRLNSDASSKISITLKLPAPYDAAIRETTDDETVLQLKKWIHDTNEIPIDIIRIKDPSGKDLLDDATTLRKSQIPDKSELAVELVLPSLSYVLSLRVVLRRGRERETVVVESTDKARQLRTMLEENRVSNSINAILPNPYFFAVGHKRKPLDENRTFVAQNILDGAVIEIVSGYNSVYMTLKLETNICIPHPKPFIYVNRIHSSCTIRDLKEKIMIVERYPINRILIKRNGMVQPNHKRLYECSITSDYGVAVEILN